MNDTSSLERHLQADPGLKEWVSNIAEFLETRGGGHWQASLVGGFLMFIIHAKVTRDPYKFLSNDYDPPDYWQYLGSPSQSQVRINNQTQTFLSWLLWEKFATAGKPPPANLRLPILRRSPTPPYLISPVARAAGDPHFITIRDLDVEMEAWRSLADEYVQSHTSLKRVNTAIHHFLYSFLAADEYPRDPIQFFQLEDQTSQLLTVLQHNAGIVQARNYQLRIQEFLDWTLEKLNAQRPDGAVDLRLKNPVDKVSYKEGALESIRRFLTDFGARTTSMASWCDYANEWLETVEGVEKKNLIAVERGLRHFFLRFLAPRPELHFPPMLFKTEQDFEDYWDFLGLTTTSGVTRYNTVSTLLAWILHEKLSYTDSNGVKDVPVGLRNPVPLRRFHAPHEVFIHKTKDPFLLQVRELDPSLEVWRRLAVEWLQRPHDSPITNDAPLKFLYYVHEHDIPRSPEQYLERDYESPISFWEYLGGGTTSTQYTYNGLVSQFLDWVVEKVVHSGTVPPLNVWNPVPRQSMVQEQPRLNKALDEHFLYLRNVNPALEGWRKYASEYFTGQVRGNLTNVKASLDRFFLDFIDQHHHEYDPAVFLRRDHKVPSYNKFLKDKFPTTAATRKARVNQVHYFLQWLIEEHFDKPEYRNPIPLSNERVTKPTETIKRPLKHQHIVAIRDRLASGTNFSDWRFAQEAFSSANAKHGDWFEVPESLIDKEDPDCVWRIKTVYHNTGQKRSRFELWSPVRAMAILMMLELPLRAHQVRMLDSGEGDSMRCEWPELGSVEQGQPWESEPIWRANNHSYPLDATRKSIDQGVFHRFSMSSADRVYTGFYVNTNKTADIDKEPADRGYIIPYQKTFLLYWLVKLRNWQEKYNPIDGPTPWTELKRKHLGAPVDRETLAALGATCFLFRHPAGRPSERHLPITFGHILDLWTRLLVDLEDRHTTEFGVAAKFVENGNPLFTLHALRVSWISNRAQGGNVPIELLSKIAGHSQVIMTIYYNKGGITYITDKLDEAEARLEQEREDVKSFVVEAEYEALIKKFASPHSYAHRLAAEAKTPAAFEFMDKGICTMGGQGCDIGGEGFGNGIFGPVPGYPERNCTRCRFFLTGPAFLPGLVRQFNIQESYKQTVLERHAHLEKQVLKLQDERHSLEQSGRPFPTPKARLIARLEQEMEEVELLIQERVADQFATKSLVEASHELAQRDEDRLQLVLAGNITDLQAVVELLDVGTDEARRKSSIRQWRLLCDYAVLYGGVDARIPAMSLSEVLDEMLSFNNMQPLFLKLKGEEKLHALHRFMDMLEHFAGTPDRALELAAGLRKLEENAALASSVKLFAESDDFTLGARLALPQA